MELFYSTSVLVAFYILLMCCNEGNLWFFITPLIIYAIYWYIMLYIVPPNIKYSVNPNWGDEKWWWTLDGWQFEEEVAAIYAKNGYITEVTKKTGDGGVDLIMYKDKKKIIVQCKHYSSPVAPEVLRALWGVKDDFRADETILVASSGVTRASWDFINNKPQFKVVDLQELMKLAGD